MTGMLARTAVMIHHSKTADGTTVSWPAIRQYHMATMGWDDIGYHAGVELINGHLEALLGRPEDETAAACKEGHMNALALHVCCVGDFDVQPPSDELLLFTAKYVVKPWLRRYHLTPAAIVGHHQFATYKSCPGTMFDLDRLRAVCQ